MPLSNSLYSQVFYNMLINPLNELKSQINLGSYREAIQTAIIMKTKVDIPDWDPFPTYQSFLNKLLIKELVSSILFKISQLSGGNSVDQNKDEIFSIISVLEAHSHLLNLLDTTYNDPEKTKAKILHNTSKKLGLFSEKPHQTYDCNLNLQFKNQNDAEQQEMPATLAHVELVQILNKFSDADFRRITALLFLTMDPIEKNNAVDNAIKSGEQNLFTLGYMEKIITLSNEYKLNFKELLDELSQPDNDQDENISNDTYNTLNNALENMFK